ncbi:hypothetical protein ABH14_30295 [Brevibacillus brevis]|uniref:reverse transcriptase domain-containing protein n=1 Tax=Brevibacillus brevis TaxID=1393 RepID=UPI0019013980|nr:reverse transcriptase domain-containing protein [Brevibacillus brevis]MBH0333971.1 hypothetical protein [Brevibacillus brevis]
MDKHTIIELAYDYVITMSKNKKYNPQTTANVTSLERFGKNKIVSILQMPIQKFCSIYPQKKVRDFVYKSDYFTPRNMYLLNPLYYLYYTFMVFSLGQLYLKSDTKLDFSRNHMDLFYSGLLDFKSTQKDINTNAIYNERYKEFQNERENYFGQPALKIDLQDFFNSIKTSDLINKLRKILGKNSVIDDLEYFFDYCGFDSLPQLHYSIASSILSQFYLLDFDSKVQAMLVKEKLHLLRFVDDMFFIHLDGSGDKKKNNNILNKVSYFLWEDSLVLNTSKTKMLNEDEYMSGYALLGSDYVGSFSSEKLIEEKANEVIREGHLILLVKKLYALEKTKGIDLEDYKKLVNEYLSIGEEDAGKVMNNILYSKKWKLIKESDLMIIVKKWRFILFNPSQFTVLYILVYRYLEKKGFINDEGLKVNKVLKYLYRYKAFTFRDTLVAVSYLLQSQLSSKSLLSKVQKVNPDYVDFIETFILRDA